MADLNRIHDLTPFTASDGRYAFGAVKYDAAARRLIATDGRIAIAVPVDGNSAPTCLLPLDRVRDAIKAAKPGKSVALLGEQGHVTLGGKAVKVLECKFPNVFDAIGSDRQVKPDTLVCLEPDLLVTLGSYANQCGADGVYLAIRPNDTRDGRVRVTDKPLTFFFVAGGQAGDCDSIVLGAVAPMDHDDEKLPYMLELASRPTASSKAIAMAAKASRFIDPPPSVAVKSTKQPVAKPDAKHSAAACQRAADWIAKFYDSGKAVHVGQASKYIKEALASAVTDAQRKRANRLAAEVDKIVQEVNQLAAEMNKAVGR